MLEKQQNALQELADEGKKAFEEMSNPMLSATAKAAAKQKVEGIQQKLLAGQQELRISAQRYQHDLTDLESRLLKIETDEIRAKVEEYAKKNGYDIIADSTMLAYSKKTLDVTDEILKIAQGVKVDDEVNKSPPKTIEQKAVATYLPEGYSSLLTIDDPTVVSFDYYDAEGNIKFIMMQTLIDENGDLTVDKSEEDTLERIKVNGFEGILVSYADQEKCYQIVWRDENYTYWIYGEFESVDELFKIAEGIALY